EGQNLSTMSAVGGECRHQPLTPPPPCPRRRATMSGACGSRCVGSANGPSHGRSRGGFHGRRKTTPERCSAISAARALLAIATPALGSSTPSLACLRFPCHGACDSDQL